MADVVLAVILTCVIFLIGIGIGALVTVGIHANRRGGGPGPRGGGQGPMSG